MERGNSDNSAGTQPSRNALNITWNSLCSLPWSYPHPNPRSGIHLPLRRWAERCSSGSFPAFLTSQRLRCSTVHFVGRVMAQNKTISSKQVPLHCGKWCKDNGFRCRAGAKQNVLPVLPLAFVSGSGPVSKSPRRHLVLKLFPPPDSPLSCTIMVSICFVLKWTFHCNMARL